MPEPFCIPDIPCPITDDPSYDTGPGTNYPLALTRPQLAALWWSAYKIKIRIEANISYTQLYDGWHYDTNGTLSVTGTWEMDDAPWAHSNGNLISANTPQEFLRFPGALAIGTPPDRNAYYEAHFESENVFISTYIPSDPDSETRSYYVSHEGLLFLFDIWGGWPPILARSGQFYPLIYYVTSGYWGVTTYRYEDAPGPEPVEAGQLTIFGHTIPLYQEPRGETKTGSIDITISVHEPWQFI